MARTKYTEHLQRIAAVQYNGSNLAELQEFAPGLITQDEHELVWCKHANADILFPVHVTDWLIDDPADGYVRPITDLAFDCRFSPSGGPAAKPAPSLRKTASKK